MWEWLILVSVIIVILVFLWMTLKPSSTSNLDTLSPSPKVGMTMYNHFKNCHLDIHLLNGTDTSENASSKPFVKFRDRIDIPLNVMETLCGNSVIRIFIIPDKGNDRYHMTDIQLNSPPGTIFRNLHIGTVTTRIIGDTQEQLNTSINQGLATMGSPFLRIHNTTKMPLSLNNGKIQVPPEDYLRFRGYDDAGVTLGMYFYDDNCLYPTFQYLKPFSDLYFGVISDDNQPLNGTYQQNFSIYYDYAQTLWPFQDGIY